MQGSSTSEHISFRASPNLVAALEQAAKSGGLSVSEAIRGMLEEQLRASRANPFARLAQAARGSLQAQRDLARQAVELVTDPDSDICVEKALTEGLVFARLAAAQGTAEDNAALIGMLCRLAMAGEDGAYPDEIAEAMARLSMSADAGDENDADTLSRLIQEMPPKFAVHARSFVDLLKQGEVA